MTTPDRDDDAQQQWVRELLSQEPRPTMPAAVKDRLMASLAAEAEARPERPAERDVRRRPWILPLAAAAAFVVLAGVILVPLLGRSGNDATTSATAPQPSQACGIPAVADADLTPVTDSTGTQYSTASFKAQSAALVSRESPGCAEVAMDAPQGAQRESGTSASTPALPGGTSPMPSDTAQTIIRCLVAVIPGQAVVAVDQAVFAGRNVVVAVVAHGPLHAYAIDCAAHPEHIVFDVSL